MARGRRIKLTLILLVIAASALALFSWTRVWIDVTVAAGAAGSGQQQLQASGEAAAPALTALALAGLALAGALTIAGPVIRLILGVLEVLLGFSVALSAFLAVSDPADASASVVTAATGIAGDASIRDGISGTALTAWPFVALGSGAAMALAGIAILATAHTWPRSTSRYQAARLEPADPNTEPVTAAPRRPQAAVAGPAHAGRPADANSRAVDSWDDLSRGSDPTR